MPRGTTYLVSGMPRRRSGGHKIRRGWRQGRRECSGAESFEDKEYENEGAADPVGNSKIGGAAPVEKAHQSLGLVLDVHIV